MIKTVCIMCPLGCELTIEQNKSEVKVSGNTCIRGAEYGKSEILNPVRNISTLVKIKDGRVVPVKLTASIPKNKIKKCLDIIAKLNLEHYPKINDVVIKNILGLGVDVVCIGY